jgi:hypothetical protein
MDPDKHLDLLAEAVAQYRWGIVNITIAVLCVVLAGGAFMHGYVVAGLLTLVISLAVVWNADVHKNRGNAAAREANAGSES